jgi:pimeloyl-ACP methyl ester carboxylesterase
MKTVTSKDGTRIAYDQTGNGPVIILVSGALGERSHPAAADLAAALAPHFTVINYDRRGRGDSGDTPPYAVAREVEDLAALIEAAGGQAALFGKSSGAVLALEAASRLPNQVSKVALYEPPLILDDSRPPVPKDYVQRIDRLVAEGRRGDAVEVFMREAVRIPDEYLAQMRGSSNGDKGATAPPEWQAMERMAHTLAYDGAIMSGLMAGKPLPANKWAANTAPTLIITGGNSDEFFHEGASALAKDLPQARHSLLPGQDHNVATEAVAPMLAEFFKA